MEIVEEGLLELGRDVAAYQGDVDIHGKYRTGDFSKNVPWHLLRPRRCGCSRSQALLSLLWKVV